jgi:hypothetical protein
MSSPNGNTTNAIASDTENLGSGTARSFAEHRSKQ